MDDVNYRTTYYLKFNSNLPVTNGLKDIAIDIYASVNYLIIG